MSRTMAGLFWSGGINRGGAVYFGNSLVMWISLGGINNSPLGLGTFSISHNNEVTTKTTTLALYKSIEKYIRTSQLYYEMMVGITKKLYFPVELRRKTFTISCGCET